MSAQTILKTYTDQLSQVRKNLTELQRRADKVRTQQDQHDAAQSEIEALESETTALHAERQSLQAEYATAMFEGDTAAQRKITSRRAAIDKSVDRIKKDIRSLRDSADHVDPVEVAEVRALLDSLKAPSYRELLEQLEPVLEQGKKEFNASLQAARNGLPSTYDAAHYKAVREQHDALYASQQASERYFAQKDRERQERLQRYGRGDSSTGDMLKRCGLENS